MPNASIKYVHAIVIGMLVIFDLVVFPHGGYCQLTSENNFGIHRTLIPVSDQIPQLMNECENGSGESCYKVGLFYQYQGDKEKSAEFYRAGCDKQLAKSCYNWGIAELSCHTLDHGFEPFSKGCALQFGASCFNLAMLDEKFGKFDEAAKNYDLACRLGIERGCVRLQHLPAARVIMPAYRFVISYRLLYVAILMVVSLFFGELVKIISTRSFILSKRAENNISHSQPFFSEYPVSFETLGKLLLSGSTALYLFAGTVIGFFIFLGLFHYVCAGYGHLSPLAIGFLISTSLTAFHKNILVLREIRKYRILVTLKMLILRPTIIFSREIKIGIDLIEDVQSKSQTLHGVHAAVVEIKLRGKRDPMRLLVLDAEGLVKGLKAVLLR